MICDICLRQHELYIDFCSEEGIRLNVSKILLKILPFCFENEPKTGNVCKECWTKIEVFHEFYMQIHSIHIPWDKVKFEENVQDDLKFEQSDDENVHETDYHAPNIVPSVILLSPANDGTKTSKPKPNRRIRSKKKSKMNSIKRDEQIPDSDIYRCDECDIVFLTKVKLYHHLKEKHLKLPFECSEKFCVESFATDTELQMHMTEYHKRSNCPYCNKSVQSDYLHDHIRYLHDESQRVICDFCGKVSKNMRIHKEHHDRVHGSEKLQCDICKAWLANIYSIRKHMTLKHLNTPQRCNLCDKVYANKNSLHRHKKLHEDSKRTDKGLRIKCLVCSKAFRFKFNMKKHMAIHSDNREVTNARSQQ